MSWWGVSLSSQRADIDQVHTQLASTPGCISLSVVPFVVDASLVEEDGGVEEGPLMALAVSS